MSRRKNPKADRSVTCDLFSHQFGWELRLLIGQELVQSRVVNSGSEPFERLSSGASPSAISDSTCNVLFAESKNREGKVQRDPCPSALSYCWILK